MEVASESFFGGQMMFGAAISLAVRNFDEGSDDISHVKGGIAGIAHGRSWALAQLHLRICWCLDQHRGRLVNGGRLHKNISHGYHVLTEQSPTQASVVGSLLLTGDQCWGEEDGAASDAKSALRLL